MNTEKFLVVTIDSTHLAMKLEKILLEQQIDVRIIPLPSELKASCGFSLKTKVEDAKNIVNIFSNNNIDSNLYSFYICEKIGFKKKFFTFNF